MQAENFNGNILRRIPLRRILPYVLCIAALALVSLLFFVRMPAGGSAVDPSLPQSCIAGKTVWDDANFSGMPRLTVPALPGNPAFLLFFYMLGAYILLGVLGCSPLTALLGSLAYGFCTANITEIYAGQAPKCVAVACIAPILAGLILNLKGKYKWGIPLLFVFAALHFCCVQAQTALYLLLAFAAVGIAFAVSAFLRKEGRKFLRGMAISVAVAAFSLLPSAGSWIQNRNYNRETTTGIEASEAERWVYGGQECFTTLIPGLYGGSSCYRLPDGSATRSLLRRGGNTAFADRAPLYWGERPFCAGPFYAGAVICLLFITGIFVVRGRNKWWTLGLAAAGFLLAAGVCLPLSKTFHLPAEALVLTALSIAVLASLALKTLLENAENRGGFSKDLGYAWGITGGIALFFAFFGKQVCRFSSSADNTLPDYLVQALAEDRMQLLTESSLYALFFVSLAGLLVLLYLRGRVKPKYLPLALSLVLLCDMGFTDRRYVGGENPSAARAAWKVRATAADRIIMADTDPNFRVFNAAANTFHDAATSRFHKSVGGYAPRIPVRYRDIIETCFGQGVNVKVLNMLNTRYFIVPGEDGNPQVQRNVAALGNAWFVERIEWLPSPERELEALQDFEPARTALVDTLWKDCVGEFSGAPLSPEDTVKLTEYRPNYLKYECFSSAPRPLIFSEIYHKNWEARIDGKPVPLYRANYILRGITVPAGRHEIEMEFTSTGAFSRR